MQIVHYIWMVNRHFYWLRKVWNERWGWGCETFAIVLNLKFVAELIAMYLVQIWYYIKSCQRHYKCIIVETLAI